MKGYVPSSPYFFRRIKIALGLMVASLMGLAAFIPAPLLGPADISRVPNPSKSAWFLLWTQELVSYSGAMIYLIVLLALCFLLLPYLPGSPECTKAQWRQKDQLPVTVLTLVVCLGIIVLTLIAAFFRGANWAFVF